ncbi:unnamed protein product [Darwinula stevensoni]|uniref:Uncharacterized protein n=1 Tax=Darwinula stevensoni TaxID=69355 RepID=A0A7R8XIR3_9CRUS|nr:unnamed protein product [Darwinula stevensoni]CAG0894538.1 unnamed protein product [Darwinula stevensoni]
MKTQDAVRAIMLVACGALALRQVILLIDEFSSSPTTTSYEIDDVNSILPPAFTFCLKPSIKSGFSEDSCREMKRFQNASVSLKDFVIIAPSKGNDVKFAPAINGEIILPLSKNGGHWVERTFYQKDTVRYFKCFTLFLAKNVSTGTRNCLRQMFIFDFKAFSAIEHERMEMEVFVHDQREQYSSFHQFRSENFILLNDTVTSVSFRPEVVEKQSTKKEPYRGSSRGEAEYEEGTLQRRRELQQHEVLGELLLEAVSIPSRRFVPHSLPHAEGSESNETGMRRCPERIQCMENCFWKRFQSRVGVSCLIPSLMPKEASPTKPECEDVQSEMKNLKEMWNAESEEVENEWRNCNCPKRCNMVDYRVSEDPTSSACDAAVSSFGKDGAAFLFFGFPSSRVPRFREKEKVTLPDLLSNIGGIVGLCLGFSLISVFDVLQMTGRVPPGSAGSRHRRVSENFMGNHQHYIPFHQGGLFPTRDLRPALRSPSFTVVPIEFKVPDVISMFAPTALFFFPFLTESRMKAAGTTPTLAFLVLLGAGHGSGACPEDDVAPCECGVSPAFLHPTVSCGRAASAAAISAAFGKAAWPSTFPIFHLGNNTAVKELTEEVFGGVAFDCIWISGTAIERVDPLAILSSADRLRDLQIAGSRLEDFPFRVLPELRRLGVLAVVNGSLTGVPALRSPSLRHLRLDHNEIVRVEGRGWHAPSLGHFDLSHNPLSEFPSKVIEALPRLEVFRCLRTPPDPGCEPWPHNRKASLRNPCHANAPTP